MTAGLAFILSEFRHDFLLVSERLIKALRL
jgi:hypothetical protein